jgi:hypothetical protein
VDDRTDRGLEDVDALGRYTTLESSSEPDEPREVRLQRFPLRLYARETERHDELMREFALLASHEPVRGTVPDRLLELIDLLGRRYGASTARGQEQLSDALERGEESIDLVYHLPPSAGPAAMALNDILEEAHEFCRRGELMTLAPTPEGAQFRRWYCAQIAGQLAGEPAVPWAGPLG